MTDFSIYVIMFFCIIIIILLMSFFVHLYKQFKNENNAKKVQKVKQKAALSGLLVNCPVCDSFLMPGENLVSKVFRPMNVSDQLCIINGCPHCYPVTEAGVKRVCPVCGKTVEAEGHLVARLFNKTDGKKHVLVMGCPNCCRHSPE